MKEILTYKQFLNEDYKIFSDIGNWLKLKTNTKKLVDFAILIFSLTILYKTNGKILNQPLKLLFLALKAAALRQTAFKGIDIFYKLAGRIDSSVVIKNQTEDYLEYIVKHGNNNRAKKMRIKLEVELHKAKTHKKLQQQISPEELAELEKYIRSVEGTKLYK